MKVLITGVCGFVGNALADSLEAQGIEVFGIDNLMRPGSQINRRFIHGDLRCASDVEALPACEWVIDAAANPSVLAGHGGAGSSRRLFEHNLTAMGNVLEYCRTHQAGLLLLSSSRVYSIAALASNHLPVGVDFPTTAPVSLYGATKLASEVMALEYGAAFDFPVWVTRCGVLAGAGQFGTPEQGIFAYWINAHLRRRPLRYIGFDGTGRQTRDAFHPKDLAALLLAQIQTKRTDGQRIYTAGGGPENAMSLAQLTAWCDRRFGPHPVAVDSAPRRYDIEWLAMDNTDVARDFGWRVTMPISQILEEIADHAVAHPNWLALSGV